MVGLNYWARLVVGYNDLENHFYISGWETRLQIAIVRYMVCILLVLTAQSMYTALISTGAGYYSKHRFPRSNPVIK